MSSYSYPPRPCGHTGIMYGCEHCERMRQTFAPRPCGHMGPTFGCEHCEGVPYYPPPPGPAYEPTAPPPQPPNSYPSYPPPYPPGPRPCGHTGIMYGCPTCEGRC